jgi:hypothetical protein
MPDSLKNNISNDSGNVNTSSRFDTAITPLYTINADVNLTSLYHAGAAQTGDYQQGRLDCGMEEYICIFP